MSHGAIQKIKVASFFWNTVYIYTLNYCSYLCTIKLSKPVYSHFGPRTLHEALHLSERSATRSGQTGNGLEKLLADHRRNLRRERSWSRNVCRRNGRPSLATDELINVTPAWAVGWEMVTWLLWVFGNGRQYLGDDASYNGGLVGCHVWPIE